MKRRIWVAEVLINRNLYVTTNAYHTRKDALAGIRELKTKCGGYRFRVARYAAVA